MRIGRQVAAEHRDDRRGAFEAAELPRVLRADAFPHGVGREQVGERRAGAGVCGDVAQRHVARERRTHRALGIERRDALHERVDRGRGQVGHRAPHAAGFAAGGTVSARPTRASILP